MWLCRTKFKKENYPIHHLQIYAYLVKNVDFVVGQVEGDHTAQSSKSTLLHPVDVAALQAEVGEVGRVRERTPGELLQVVIPQVQFHRNLHVRRGWRCNNKEMLKSPGDL